MSKAFKVWLDSGANIHSSRSVIISLEELGYTDEEWEAMPEVDQEEIMREIAFEQAEWGWAEVDNA